MRRKEQLTEEPVLAIRRKYTIDNVTMKELADQYDRSVITIRALLKGYTYPGVGGHIAYGDRRAGRRIVNKRGRSPRR